MPGRGSPDRLGPTLNGTGVNFAILSTNATAIDLCLFDSEGRETRHRLPGRTGDVWHGHVAGLKAGQLYGYRVHGPYAPERGHRFNPNKLLIDPYAPGLHGQIRWDDTTCGYRRGSPEADLSFDERDSAPAMPKGIVIDPAFAWGDDAPPRRPLSETVIYEAHVKGLTQLHPDIPVGLRGTYAALGHPAVIDHLTRLGVTALELLPIHAFANDRFLVERGLTNYWGYSTLGFFAPDARYFDETGPAGLKRAVAALHRAGIEIILDVVFNHTAEAEETGPTLSFRGVDNALYYKAVAGDPRRALNITGCGNTLDIGQPPVRRMVIDSLRHWVQTYHVDGFRFDLAPVLGRDGEEFDTRSRFFEALAADPVLAPVKLIAEPWDLGSDGYRLGHFPAGWSEWNDRFRDAVRGFWRGDPGQVAPLIQGLAGSREIFGGSGRRPCASINYVTSHDGYTLADLASYEERHNAPNGEGNNDGHKHNLSLNHGVEGPTSDPRIEAARARHARNCLATIMLARGVPMLLAGDELGRSQAGNNNAYCQDNATTWVDWSGRSDLAAFVAALSGLRRTYPTLRRDAFFTGEPGPNGLTDVCWLAPDGREFDAAGWSDPNARAFGMRFGGDEADSICFLLCANAQDQDALFTLPAEPAGAAWSRLLDTRDPDGIVRDPAHLETPGTFTLGARSLVLFSRSIQTGRG